MMKIRTKTIRFMKGNRTSMIFGLLVILIIIAIINHLIPRKYDYTRIKNTVYCDKKLYSPDKYLIFPMTTIVLNAGIGNQLFEIFSLLGMADKLNRTAIFNVDDDKLMWNMGILESSISAVIGRIRRISIEISESVLYKYNDACCVYSFPRLLTCEQSKYLVVHGVYFQSWKYFETINANIREWMKPGKEEEDRIRRKVMEKDVGRKKSCVHIRRGDFLTDGQHEGTDHIFTAKAIDFLHVSNPSMVFIFSNDPQWVHNYVVPLGADQKDITVMDTDINKAIEDLIFAQVWCDSVLITAPSSTFGWWMGYLSRNQKQVYYRDIYEIDENVKHQMIEDDFYPREWIKIGLLSNGSINIK